MIMEIRAATVAKFKLIMLPMWPFNGNGTQFLNRIQDVFILSSTDK
jgi:hypothetical protein